MLLLESSKFRALSEMHTLRHGQKRHTHSLSHSHTYTNTHILTHHTEFESLLIIAFAKAHLLSCHIEKLMFCI